MGGGSRGEEQRADSLQLPVTAGLCACFANIERVIREPDMFSEVLFFLCFYFFPLEMAAIIITKDGGESRVVGTDTW